MFRAAALIALLVVAAAALYLHSAVPPQERAPTNSVSLLVMLGERSRSVERWDGTARVTGTRLASITPRHFSNGDAVSGDSWKCVTRRDEVAPFADVHYTEMRPGSRPEVLFQPIGVYLTIEGDDAARVSVETAQGNFAFALTEIGSAPKDFLDGRVNVRRVPSPIKLTEAGFEDDEPSLTAFDGGLAAAWVAYRDRADRIFVRLYSGNSWSQPEEVTVKPGDIFRVSTASDGPGSLFVIWSERENTRWHLWARRRVNGSWQAPARITDAGSNTFHRAAAGGGRLHVTWQSYRNGQGDIYLKTFDGRAWLPETRLTDSPANEWEPAIATSSDGAAHVAWDTYSNGNYDIEYRSVRDGRASTLEAITSSPRFQAHAAVAVDGENRPWVAWDESGVNWGKDQGFLIPTPLATPLHQERSLRLARRDGSRWMEPAASPVAALPAPMRSNAEHPQLAFLSTGQLVMAFRHWTRRNARTIGSLMAWENYVTTLDGDRWVPPAPVPVSAGSIEKHSSLARDSSGAVWGVWMTDQRPFATQVPGNADVYAARLANPHQARTSSGEWRPFAEPPVEEIPVHNREPNDVRAIRDYTIEASGKRYRIYRGDMHRHTDVSQDFKYDGSLIEVYRYGLDSAAMDYIVPTDHQSGYDQEFTWWQNQKLVDLFTVEGAFTPLYGYERSLPFPNGHRNIVWAERGHRTLPIPEDERLGKEGAKKLYAELRRTRGISMPHSSATAQGTDWRDNDPEVEPLIEIYQGYRTSYEYEGAPRAASTLNQHAQKSGWQPEGFWWNALAKGHKLGVQSSSDHWSTHISYAMIVADVPTRQGLLDAIRARHAYAATDNIILDFRAVSGGRTHIMGDAFRATGTVEFEVRSSGTGAIKQVDLIKDRKFIYTSRPNTKDTRFTFTDRDAGSGESWYYTRVLQEDGQIAWSSPIWVTR